MKFGKTDTPYAINFQLPPDEAATQPLLKKAAGPPLSIYVGCAKWNKAELKGFYPKGIKDELSYYAQQFNCTELNATFYNLPAVSQIIKWKEKTPPEFRFFPKITNSISHYKRLLNVKQATEDYCNTIAHFEEKLGMVFLQLHENFSPREFEKLQVFIQQFPVGIPLTVELRNEAWFTHEAVWNTYCTLLEKHTVSNTLVDAPARRDMLHMRLTTPTAFVRWVCCNVDAIDYKRLDDWVLRIRAWQQQGLQQLYFFVHQGHETSSPVFAAYFIQQLNKALHKNLQVPVLATGGQGSLF